MVKVVLPAALSATKQFLVDTGADRTVFTRSTLDSLGRESLPPSAGTLSGVGGHAGIVSLDLHIELPIDGGGTARVNGPFSAFLDPDAIDTDVLGRDVLNNFEVIVSRRRGEVLLLAPPHGYQVTGP